MNARTEPSPRIAVDLVVFDLDGTIIDSEWAHEEAKVEIQRDLGVKEYLKLGDYTGRSNRVFWQDALSGAGLAGDVDALVKRQFALVSEKLRARQQPESPGLTPLLRALSLMGIQCAVASGSEAYFIESILRHLNIADHFDWIVSGNDLKNLKPAPDLYLAVLSQAGISADHAITIEDSAAGCEAAQRAGMRCIGYTFGGSNPQDLSHADILVAGLEEVVPRLEKHGTLNH